MKFIEENLNEFDKEIPRKEQWIGEDSYLEW